MGALTIGRALSADAGATSSAIERALRDVQRDLPGSWRLDLRRGPPLLIEIEGPDNFEWPIQIAHPDQEIGALLDRWRSCTLPDADARNTRGGTAWRVLVVDDQVDVRELLCSALTEAGYLVEAAGDGRTALERIEAGGADLVILELALPGMDGWEVLDRLGYLSSPPPVVAMAGRDASRRSLALVPRQVQAYLSKPFPMDSLLRACDRILVVGHRRAESPPEDRRRAKRRALIVDVTLLSSEGQPVASGRVLDLSTGGVQVDLGVPLAQDSQVKLGIALPDAAEPLIATAEVRWREGHVVGMRFVDLPSEAVDRLAALVG